MYKFIIKKFEDNSIFLSDDQKTVEVTLDEFSDRFYGSRNFPFSGHFLPKVLAYYSPVFDYEGDRHAYLITQMRPTIRKSIDENILFPWSFFFVLVNLDKSNIVESHLFFGKNQMMSEDYHQFYVPNVTNDVLKVSKFFSEKLLLETPSFHSDIKCRYDLSNFGSLINDLHETSLEVFFKNFVVEELEFVRNEDLGKDADKEKIEEKFSTYWKESYCFEADSFDSFALSQHQNPTSFLDLSKYFLEK